MIQAVVQMRIRGSDLLRARIPAAFQHGVNQLDELLLRTGAEVGAHCRYRDDVLWRFSLDSIEKALQWVCAIQYESMHLDWQPALLSREEASEVFDDEMVVFRGLRLSIAVHCGTVPDDLFVDEPVDLFTARLMDVAAPGQTLVTEATLNRAPAAEGIYTRRLGKFRLVGGAGRVNVVEIIDCRLQARPIQSLRAAQAITTNLGRDPTAFFGRAGDLDAISALIELGVKQITISGESGVGTSRLARQLVRLQSKEWREGGAWWLTGSRSASRLCREVASTLGIPLWDTTGFQDEIERVAYALSVRGPTLLVIDGVSPSSSVSRLLDSWRMSAPNLTMVCTSPKRLGLNGEVRYILRPYRTLGAEDPSVRQSAGVRLIQSRAKKVDNETVDVSIASALVRSLRGRPWALVVAGGMVSKLPDPSTFDLESFPDAVFSALSAVQSRVLRHCSVFSFGFSYADALSIVDTGDLDGDVGTALKELVLMGLLDRLPSRTSGVPRYRVQRVFQRQLWNTTTSAGALSIAQRFALHTLDRAERWAEGADGLESKEMLDRLSVEWGNLMSVFKGGLNGTIPPPLGINCSMRALLCLHPLLRANGPRSLHQELLDQVISQTSSLGVDPLLITSCLVARAELHRVNRSERTQSDLARASANAERWTDAENLARVSQIQARMAFAQGLLSEALEGFERAELHYDKQSMLKEKAFVAAEAAVVLMSQGKLEIAREQLQASVMVLTEQHSSRRLSHVLRWQALLSVKQGNKERAIELYQSSAFRCELIGARLGECRALASMARLAFEMNDVHQGQVISEQALRLARWCGDRRLQASVLLQLAHGVSATAEISDLKAKLLEIMALARTSGLSGIAGEASALLGVVHLLSDELEEAEQNLKRGLAEIEQCGLTNLSALYFAWWAMCAARQHAEGASERRWGLASQRLGDQADDAIVEVHRILIGEPIHSTSRQGRLALRYRATLEL